MKRLEASPLSAFLLGATSPVLLHFKALLVSDSLAARSGAAMVMLLYLVAIFFFVHGPATWSTYRWVPADGHAKALVRALSCLVGAALAIILFAERTRVGG